MKIAYIISNIDRWMAFEWIEEHFRNTDIQIDFYLLSSERGFFYQYLKDNNQNVQWLRFTSKGQYPYLILKLTSHFRKHNYLVAHCHFLDATICGLTAAKIAGIKRRIYTRHHSTSHHEFAPKGVLYDKYCNFIATKVIAISGVVKKTLIEKEGVNTNKIVTIHHGFKLEEIREVDDGRIQNISVKYQLQGNYVIGVVSRFIELKGLQYIIPAFKEFLKNNKEVILVLANARGNYEDRIKILLKDIPAEKYRLIPFERDIYALFHNFNIFVHVPISPDIEAFGQIYIEALAASVPSIFTLSGIAHDFAIDQNNSLIVPYKDSNAILSAIKSIFKDQELSDKLIENGQKVVDAFIFDKMAIELEAMYS